MNCLGLIRILILLFLLSFSLCAPISAQSRVETITLPFSAIPYVSGERLTYNVSFSNFPTAAYIELTIGARGTFSGRAGVPLIARVQTLDVVGAALYSLNNEYTSFVDPATGLPFRFQQLTREGARTANSARDYTQPVGNTSRVPTQSSAIAFPGTYDFISALYRLRALPLTQNSVYRFSVNYNADQYEAELKVTGRQLLKTTIGSFNAIATQVRVPGNNTINDLRIRIYFSDDERHVPVLLTARHPSGELRAEIASADLPAIVPTTVAAPTVAQASPPAAIMPTNPPPASNPDNTLIRDYPFRTDEQLNFNFFLNNFAQPVGTLSFQVRPRATYFGQNGLFLSGTAQTTGLASVLLRINDQINSYVSPATLLPFRSEIRIMEGRRVVNQVVTFDQNRGVASTDSNPRIDIPVNTYDPISVFYALRSFDLTPPKRTTVSLFVNNRPLQLSIAALRRETIELNRQRIQATQLSLTTNDPQPDKYAIRLWISNDKRRLPLRITATTPLGPLRADLAIIPVTNQ